MHTLERFHIALILITMHAATVYGLDASAASCRKYIASSADSLAITTIAKEVACHQKRMLGTIASTVDCNDIASTGFPSSSVTSIEESATTFENKIGSKCSGQTPAALGYTSCSSPCDSQVPSVSTMQDVATCAVCQAEHLASAAVETAYGSNPPVLPSKSTAWTCQNTDVGTAMKSYVSTRTKQQLNCEYKEDKGTITATDCKTADLTGSIAKAATSLESKIAKCSSTDLGALTSCGGAVAAEQSCVVAAADTLTDSLFDVVYPTVTTSGCPSSNFLDLSGAPSAGAGYPAASLSVSCSGNTVTVNSNGIPPYTFVSITPNGLAAQNYTFHFPSAPAAAAQTTTIPLLGTIGVAVNGMPLFGPNEAATPDPYGDPVVNAILDECLGHTGPGGSYHYHALLVKCLIASGLVAQPWNNPDPSADQPSPIIAYAFDGYPIYGPYECTDTGCSAVQEMLSSWDNVGVSAGTQGCTSSSQCGSTSMCAPVMINGAADTACVPKNCAWSNNKYVAKAGVMYLDQCNGHIGPNGDYHYHATATFPYMLGCYHGTPANNGGNGTPPGGSCS